MTLYRFLRENNHQILSYEYLKGLPPWVLLKGQLVTSSQGDIIVWVVQNLHTGNKGLVITSPDDELSKKLDYIGKQFSLFPEESECQKAIA